MTPLEEQLEKLARRWEKEADEGELLDEVAYALEGAADELRALLPLEVTDESPLRVTVDTADLIELLYGATTDSPANRKARTRLRAALTQKGEGNDGLYADQNCCVHCGWITCARLEDCLATEGDNES